VYWTSYEDVPQHDDIRMVPKTSRFGRVLSWINNFLSGRSQVTRIGHSYSNVTYLSSGVVQGSCIGSLLFLIYVNDVSEAFPDGCVCKLYADDI